MSTPALKQRWYVIVANPMSMKDTYDEAVLEAMRLVEVGHTRVAWVSKVTVMVRGETTAVVQPLAE